MGSKQLFRLYPQAFAGIVVVAAVPEDFAETAVIPLIALCMAVTGCAVDCNYSSVDNMVDTST